MAQGRTLIGSVAREAGAPEATPVSVVLSPTNPHPPIDARCARWSESSGRARRPPPRSSWKPDSQGCSCGRTTVCPAVDRPATAAAAAQPVAQPSGKSGGGGGDTVCQRRLATVANGANFQNGIEVSVGVRSSSRAPAAWPRWQAVACSCNPRRSGSAALRAQDAGCPPARRPHPTSAAPSRSLRQCLMRRPSWPSRSQSGQWRLTGYFAISQAGTIGRADGGRKLVGAERSATEGRQCSTQTRTSSPASNMRPTYMVALLVSLLSALALCVSGQCRVPLALRPFVDQSNPNAGFLAPGHYGLEIGETVWRRTRASYR